MPYRIGLVGCVKKKLENSAPAAEIYTSSLFKGRRAFVERSCDEWWILSALHGLVSPTETLSPYDVTLKSMGRSERRAWSQRVVEDFRVRSRAAPGVIVEIHAGSDYRDFGLLEGLQMMGCIMENPTEGLPFGAQLSFYSRLGS